MSADTIIGDDEVDTTLLRLSAAKAEGYLRSFHWCRGLSQGAFVDGYGGIFALFIFQADIEKVGNSVWLWVFVGDIPTTYLEAQDYTSPFSAAKRYVDGVSEWINAVRLGHNLAGLIPISASIAGDSLLKLEMKIETLRTLVLPHLQTEPLKRLTERE